MLLTATAIIVTVTAKDVNGSTIIRHQNILATHPDNASAQQELDQIAESLYESKNIYSNIRTSRGKVTAECEDGATEHYRTQHLRIGLNVDLSCCR